MITRIDRTTICKYIPEFPPDPASCGCSLIVTRHRASHVQETGRRSDADGSIVTCPARKQNCAGDLQVFRDQAARVYSLIRPPRIGFRRICCVPASVTVARGGIDADSVQDLPDGGRRGSYTGFRQFAMDPAVSPQRVFLRLANGRAGDALDRRRAAGLAPLARAVLARGQFAVPGQRGRGRDRKDLAPAPARYEPCQRSEPGPVSGLVPRPAGVAAQHRVLVAQDQQPGVLGQITTEQHDQQPGHGTDDQVNEGEDHPR